MLVRRNRPWEDAIFAFFSAIARSPHHVGAVAPSSRFLGDRLASVVPADRPVTVVELGAGTGSVTRRLKRQVANGSRLVVIERDEALARHLEAEVPGAEVVCGDARELGTILESMAIERLDAVVCGLPWALFTSEETEGLLNAITGCLGADGVFTSFAYVHALPLAGARNFRDELERRFTDVRTTKPVLMNLPPATTYVCRN